MMLLAIDRISEIFPLAQPPGRGSPKHFTMECRHLERTRVANVYKQNLPLAFSIRRSDRGRFSQVLRNLQFALDKRLVDDHFGSDRS